jgi:transposase
MGRQRRDFTEDFKRDAVRMMRGRGSRTVAEIADDLGVSPNLLHRWAQKLDKDAIAKRNADGETLDQEVRRLRKEVEQLRVEKAILKKPRPSSPGTASNAVPLYSGGEGPLRRAQNVPRVRLRAEHLLCLGVQAGVRARDPGRRAAHGDSSDLCHVSWALRCPAHPGRARPRRRQRDRKRVARLMRAAGLKAKGRKKASSAESVGEPVGLG